MKIDIENESAELSSTEKIFKNDEQIEDKLKIEKKSKKDWQKTIGLSLITIGILGFFSNVYLSNNINSYSVENIEKIVSLNENFKSLDKTIASFQYFDFKNKESFPDQLKSFQNNQQEIVLNLNNSNLNEKLDLFLKNSLELSNYVSKQESILKEKEVIISNNIDVLNNIKEIYNGFNIDQINNILFSNQLNKIYSELVYFNNLFFKSNNEILTQVELKTIWEQNKKLLNLFKEMGDINSNFLNNKGIVPFFNKISAKFEENNRKLNEFVKNNSELNKNKFNFDSLLNLTNEINLILEKETAIAIKNKSNNFIVYLYLLFSIMGVLGVALLFLDKLSSSKLDFYNIQNKHILLEQEIEDITDKFKQYSIDRKIPEDNVKNNVLKPLFNEITLGWKKNKELSQVFDLKTVEQLNSLNNLKKLTQEIINKNGGLLKKNEKTVSFLNEIENFLNKLENYFDLQINNISQVNDQKKLLNDFIKNNNDSYHELKNKINNLSEILKNISESIKNIGFYSENTKSISENAEVLALNSQLLINKQNKGSDRDYKAFSKISENIITIFKKLNEIIENINNNAKYISNHFGKLNKELNDLENELIVKNEHIKEFDNKIKNKEIIEDKIFNKRQEIYDVYKELNFKYVFDNIKNTLSDLNKLQEKDLLELSFMENNSIELNKEIKTKLDQENFNTMSKEHILDSKYFEEE